METNMTDLAADKSSLPTVAAVVYYGKAYASVSILGVVINLFVIALTATRNIIPGKIPRLLLLNQCVSDMLCSLFNAVLWIQEWRGIVPDNALGTALCRLWFTGALYWGMVQISVNNLILLTVERYLSIVQPVAHRRYVDIHLVRTSIAFCWMSGLLIETTSMFMLDRNGTACVPIQLSPTMYRAWSSIELCTFLLFPLVVLLYCNCRMLFILKRHRSTFSSRQSSARDRVKLQLSFTVAFVGISYLFLFAPNSIVLFLTSINAIPPITGTWYYGLITFLVTLSFLLNPLVYALSMSAFRREIQRLFRCSRRDNSNIESMSTLVWVSTSN